MLNNSTIIKKIGIKPGKTLAIFAGVHGNETVGVTAMKKVLESIKIDCGSVYFVLANSEAFEKNVRYLEKDLNRCFLPNNNGDTIEDKRAKELMKILDESDALLDSHSSNSPKTNPFIICEKHSFEVAKIFDFEIVSCGWDEFEAGATDGYMNTQNKVGICLECGSVFENKEELAIKSIYQFLKYFGAIVDENVVFNNRKQKFLKIIQASFKETEDLFFAKDFEDFETLESGKIFAKDGSREYIAGDNECILFPRLNKKIGEEIFLIGKWVE